MNGLAADRLAIAIVTFNSEAEIGHCLAAACRTGAEVVVVDNGSSDRTLAEVEKHGSVRLIANGWNAGFARAVNQVFRATTQPFILLLNPDAVLQTGVEPLLEQAAASGTGAAGGCLVDARGVPQRGFNVRRLPTPWALIFEALLINRLWPGNPVNWRYRCFDFDLKSPEPLPVEQPAGAFLMIRREAWERVGGFDESFHPLWFEDVDFCYRLLAAGWVIFYVPGAVAKHTGAHSIRNMTLEIRNLCWYGSVLRYASKHYPPLMRKLLCCSIVAGSLFRSFASLFRGDAWRCFAVCWRVTRLAAAHFSNDRGLQALG